MSSSSTQADPLGNSHPSQIRQIKAKHPWPPDLNLLSDSEKYRLERKWKRRMRRAQGHGPRWLKFTGVLQILTVTALPAWMILFMDWKDMPHPFGPVRAWMWERLDSIWTVSSSQTPNRGSTIIKEIKKTKTSDS